MGVLPFSMDMAVVFPSKSPPSPNPPEAPAHAKKKYRKNFSAVEDELLATLVKRMGPGNWDIIASHLPDRTARQCRDRWKFYLCPSVNRDPWSREEDRLLFNLFQELGPKWSVMCQHFQNRSLNNIKNRWHSVTRKVRAAKLSENSAEDFMYCASLITQQVVYGCKKRTTTPEPASPSLDPSFFFQISNLLNNPQKKTVACGIV